MAWYWWYAISVGIAAVVIGFGAEVDGHLTGRGVLVAIGLAAIWPLVVLWLLVVAIWVGIAASLSR